MDSKYIIGVDTATSKNNGILVEEIHKANARRDKHYAQLERRAKVFYCLLEKYNDEQCKNIVRTYMKQPQTIGGYLLNKYREFDAWFTRNFGWFFTNGNKK